MYCLYVHAHAHASYIGTCNCLPAYLPACWPICPSVTHSLFESAFIYIIAFFYFPPRSLLPSPSFIFAFSISPHLLTFPSSPHLSLSSPLPQGPLHHSSDETSSTERLLPPSRVSASVSVRTLSLSGPAPTVTHIPPHPSLLFSSTTSSSLFLLCSTLPPLPSTCSPPSSPACHL
jgi:hypothetical protein